MKRITAYIEILIRRHDYVIVPGLGGFLFQKQAAVITDNKQTPPQTIISYNKLMNVSDGLLAIELSRAERISFREAVEAIQREVDSAKQKLAAGKELQIGNLGQLYSDDEQKLNFIQSENSSFIPQNFGLSTLHYNTLQQGAADDEAKRRVIQIVLPSTKAVARYAAVAAVAAGIFFLTPKLQEQQHNFSSFDFLSKKREAIVRPGTKSLPESKRVEPAVAAFSSETTEPGGAASDLATAIQEPEKRHHVIVSAMPTQETADALCLRLKELNYTDAHVLEPIKTYRVAISSFADKGEAIRYMQQLRNEKPQFADAWVLSDN